MAQGEGKVFIKFNTDEDGERKSRLERVVEEGENLRKLKRNVLEKFSKQNKEDHNFISKDFKDNNVYKGIKESLEFIVTDPPYEDALALGQEQNIEQAIRCIDKLYYLQDELVEITSSIKEGLGNKEDLERQLVVYMSLYAEITVQLKDFAFRLRHDQNVYATCSKLVISREEKVIGKESEIYKKLFNICSYYRELDNYFLEEKPEATGILEITDNNNVLEKNNQLNSKKESSSGVVYMELQTKEGESN